MKQPPKIRFFIREHKFWVDPKLRKVTTSEWIAETSDLKVCVRKTDPTTLQFLVVESRGVLHRDVYYNNILVLKDIYKNKNISTTLKITIPPVFHPNIEKPITEIPRIIPTDNRKRICFITSNSCIGGVEKLILTLLKHINDYQKVVIVTEIKGELHEEYEKYSDLCFYEPNKDSVKAFLESNIFDVYHIFNSMCALDLLSLMHGRVVMSMFGDYTQPLMWFTMRKDAFIKNIEYVDVITTDNKRNVGVLGNFPIQIDNGIDMPVSVHQKDLTAPKVAWIGRNSGEKRPEALYETAKNCQNVTFLVAMGHSYKTTENMRLLNKIRSQPNIVLAVNADENTVYSMLDQSVILLNTSMMEGLPVALLEGMARGCYPVAPDVGGIKELINDVGTVVDDLKRLDYSPYINVALERCHNPDLINRIRSKVAKYDAKLFVDKMNRIYLGEVTKDKTAILNIAKKIHILTCGERLANFINAEPWNTQSNLVYGEKLYYALFDVELKGIPFWYSVIKKGYTRERFTFDLIKLALEINDDEAVKETILGIHELLTQRLKADYPDDDINYIPG